MNKTRSHDRPVILWFRRDLRLADNPALSRAMESGAPLICVYIRERGDAFAGALGAAQAWWLHHSLTSLDASLKARGNRLVTLTGDPRVLVEWLIKETGASAMFWNRRYDGPGREVDSDIKSNLKAHGTVAESLPGFLLHDPAQLQTKQGRKFSVYTPFWKAFAAAYEPGPIRPAPKTIPAADHGIDPEPVSDWSLLPTKPNWATGFEETWQPGEDGAKAALDAFLSTKVGGYGHDRDFPAIDAASRLSPHLAFGEISPAAIWHATLDKRRNIPAEDGERFRKEIVWREFAWHTLFHNPDMAEVNLDRRFDAFAWTDKDADFRAWTKGMTGYPIVDAGMRELWHTGTMHNRVRMIVASFLIKDLLIDWRRGEKWFLDTLVDADAASNPFNWQWVAGCGADAAPFFRIFNPTLQGEKFDPRGDYVKRWCPELAKLPEKFVHRPFEADSTVLKKAGFTPGETYPKPIVDHGKARDAALAALKATREDADEG